MTLRSALFVPGNRPERFAKAVATGADRIIVDFEDAVEPGLKNEARDNLADFLENHAGNSIMVRINAVDTDFYEEDLRFCRAHPQLKAVMVPKAESTAQIKQVAETGLEIWPLIESAKGLLSVGELAATVGVEHLTFGALDLAVSLRVNPADAEAQLIFDQVRYSLLVHSAANGLAAPFDTIYPDIKNEEGLKAFARHGRGLGLSGMLCIHPSQVEVATAIFGTQDADVAWARRVLAAAEGQPGVFRFEGQMVDAPVLLTARRLLQI